MTEDKSSNLMIIGLGIVAIFFAYLVYMKSTQSQQISDTLTSQIQLIQKQNLNLLERLTLLESTTCSNVVSMNSNTNNKDINNNINNTIDTTNTADTIDTINNLNLVKNLKFI